MANSHFKKIRHTTHQGIARSDTQVFERAMPLMYTLKTCKQRGGSIVN